MVTACSITTDTLSPVEEQASSSEQVVDTANNSVADEETTVSEDAGAESVADAAAENSSNHDDAEDYVWDSADMILIGLNGSSITTDGDGVTVEGSTATISSAGTYSLSGSLTDGQIIVDTEDEDIVRLILNGVDLNCSTSAPIFIASSEKVIIVLADGTENRVSDAASYVFEDAEEDEPNAAIFSKSDLTITGSGSLTVTGNYNDGIASKDGLIIDGGSITVDAIDDGIRGKDYLIVKEGSITVNAQGDGLKSDNEEDTEKGYISIEAGTLNITSGGDAIQAQTDVLVAGGNITLSSGGGSGTYIDETTSAKGIKGTVNVNIDGGTFNIDSADDAIHSNGSITVNAGSFVIASGDDGMHADSSLDINDGDVQITKSYEGLESAEITINGGTFHIVASDDGINIAGGNDGSGMNWGPGQGGQMPQGDGMAPDGAAAPDGGMAPGGGPGQGGRPGGGGMDQFAASGDYHLTINGGMIVVDAGGDGLDSNGSVDMTGGVVLVNGPTNNGNGALDCGTFNITGGFLMAAGSSGMAEAPDDSSSQYSVLINFDSAQAAGSLVHIQSSAGDEILTFAPTKQYQSIVFSSPKLANGETYDVYLGGSSTGTPNDSLYEGGSYTPGTQYTSLTISGMVTRIGSRTR
ncbi:MAG: carbohydrate-binding domain-containing protein [Anaerolineae bacterium]|nr:carbohydrate-binding domain-containing protein [Anaerolineae bacterium]